MSLYVQVPIQQIADGLTAIGWSSGGGGGDASLTYSATAPASPINGTLWWDTTNTLLKIYTGGVWTTVNVSAETIASISTSVSQAQSAATSASNSASQALAAKNAITGMQVATGEAGSSVTWNGTTLTVPQGIQGIQGDAGEVTAQQLADGLATKASTVHTHTKADVGLGNVDNTSDMDKPVSTATATAVADIAAEIEGLIPTQTGNAGKALITDGVTTAWGDVTVSSGLKDYQEFTTSGTWTKPDGIASVYVEILSGGGGGGAYAHATDGTKLNGGAGGNCVLMLLDANEVADNVSVLVGAGGVGASIESGNAAGGTGGASSFGDVNVIGGTGGILHNAQTYTGSFVGTAFGGEKQYTSIYGGGRGGDGTSTSMTSGRDSLLAGAGGDGFYSTVAPAIGNNGIFPSGGGGGTRLKLSSGTTVGGDGGAGRVRDWCW